jgi:hypothetical protein
MTTISATITSFVNGATPDIYDTDSITALTAITKMQDFSGCPASPVDSFVPSMSNTTLVGCSLSASTVTAGTCTSAANF